MATENQQNIRQENPSEVPPDSELFVGEVHKELSEREVFVGDEDFYKLLTGSPKAAAAQPRRTRTKESRHPTEPTRHKRFSTLQKALVGSIAAIAAILLYAVLKSPSEPVTAVATIPPTQQTTLSKPPVEDVTQVAPQQIQKPEAVLTPTQPLSLRVAQDFFLQKDYDKAYAAYNQLRQSLPTSIKEALMRDFLQLRLALCMRKAADYDQASRLFRTVLRSRSPIVRIVANYHLGLIEMQKKQYLKARTRAYQTIALIDVVDINRDWVLSLQRDCYFLVAESMTRNVLLLCDADKDIPEGLWSGDPQIDPFINLNEAQLRSFLNSGSGKLSKALLGPQIQQFEHQSASPRWSVICHGASIEELLTRFAANVGLDIHWTFGLDSIGIRKRMVSLYLNKVTTPQFVTAAAGCVGLLARLDEKKTVNVFNPDDYSFLSEHVSLFSQEAISLWQRFLLTFHDDERLPIAHFALGLLQAQKGQVADAIAEYKLVANRFSQASLAPFALLHSSKLKTSLRDYSGAREDLKQLVEQYPDTEIAGQACLCLADATMKARLYDEAGRLYRKVYNLGWSLESQTASALGAGRCFYDKKDYEAAAKWLTRYISLAQDQTSKDLYSTYFLLGKTNLALGKLQQACDALRYALTGQLSREEYVETVSALVKSHMKQENFIKALDVLENIRSWQFSQKESIEILLLKSKVLRAMGLVDKAIMALGDRAEYIPDPQLKAKISFELTNCYIAKGNLELARSKLTEILIIIEPGPFAHRVALELADVCLKLGQNSQTISICSQLLDSGLSTQIKQKALGLLATAYNQQKNYDRAALALLGRWNGAEAQTEKRTFGSPATTGQTLHQTQ